MEVLRGLSMASSYAGSEPPLYSARWPKWFLRMSHTRRRASVDSAYNVMLEFPLLEANTQWFRNMLLKAAVTSSLMSLVSQGDSLNYLILLKSP